MVTADIEKAFDSVDHNFLFATLKKFGLGPEFISWVRVLIKNKENCITNNGNDSILEPSSGQHPTSNPT